MSLSRGTFLKQLGKSLPGLVLGSGVGAAAHALLNKVAAASGAPMTGPKPMLPPEVREAKIEFPRCGSGEGNRIALTFDDGPTPGVTERILDELKQRKVTATFFMIGEKVVAQPELARRVLAEGHAVGNHTFTHAKLTELTEEQVNVELEKTYDAFAELLDHQATWFRPPFGALRMDQARLVSRRGLRVVLWSVDPADWALTEEAKIVGTVMAETKPGSIILCHDLQERTAHSIGEILDGLVARDFVFVTLDDLLRRDSDASLS